MDVFSGHMLGVYKQTFLGGSILAQKSFFFTAQPLLHSTNHGPSPLAVRLPNDRAAAGDLDLRLDDLHHGDRAGPAAADRGVGAGAAGGHG